VAIANCSHWAQALRLAKQNARVKRTQRDWAELLDMSVGTFNTLLNADHYKKAGKRIRNLDPDEIADIEYMFGNNALSQYLDMRKKGQLYCQRRDITPQEELANLKQRAAELESKIANG
jgi:hypothetical protein